MYILGISGSAADASACLLKDGRVVAAVEEERLTRRKHIGGFPTKAVAFCLSQAGITPSEIDHIGFHCEPRLHLTKRIPRLLKNIPRAPLDNTYTILDELRKYGSMTQGQMRRPFPASAGWRAPVHAVEHHRTHAASAYFTSGQNDAAILTFDFIGEIASTVLWHGSGNTIKKIAEVRFPHSLGALYSYVTEWLGFRPHSDEYKVMGLAPYGTDALVDKFRPLVKLTPNGLYRLNLDWFDFWYRRRASDHDRFHKTFGPRRASESEITAFHRDAAFAVQRILEETVFHVVEYLQKKTKSETLCLAGGVALNSVLNGKLAASGLFKHVHACPASHDGGLSLGTALHVYCDLLNVPKEPLPELEDVYWGPSYTDDEIKQTLDDFKIPARKLTEEEIAPLAAEKLAQKRIVGWFQGREEFGPRALGNRSILADPRDESMKDRVNACIKFREGFRPFAPAVLAERAADFFETDHESPFMLFVYPVKENKKSVIPAVTHQDGTGRVQTVRREVNPRYYDTINAFGKLTGVPVLMNTSFNVRGEPIVSSPADAIRCFYSTGLDDLFLGSYLLEKDQ